MRASDLSILGMVLARLLAALLSAPPIVTRGEAREGLVVREMVARGEWILPQRQGMIASKPPLYHWLRAAAVRGFGWSDTAGRLPWTVAAWARVLETFAVGLVIGGAPSAAAPRARDDRARAAARAAPRPLGLPENDVLVLAYLLDRPLRRARVSCDRSDAGSYYLRPVLSGRPR
jgi:hypothetical protein